MALYKRDRFSFRWSKSELPDNDDINTQVLLLGITRFETTPSPIPSIKLLATNDTANTVHKLPTNVNELNASNRCTSIASSDIECYESFEQLNKTTGCFPLDRQKSNKTIHKPAKRRPNDSANVAIDVLSKPHDILLNEPKSHRNHFDRLIHRFQSKEDRQTNLGVTDNSTHTNNTIEQKTFYRWLNLSRTKRLERVKCINDADQWQTLRTPVIRKCSTKTNSIRRKVTKKQKTTTKSSTSSRLSSCLPYCVAATKSRTNSIADNSLASNHRYTEYCAKKRADILASTDHHRHRFPANTNDCLMHSYCKSNKHCSPSNKHTDNNHNNNCSLFNNLNIMDRSVDSIGSCSLDVDAESTDFSDTSGSLNVCTPSSGKDFTREFTSRIHERCQFPAHQSNNQKLQQTKTVLDPNSGKISTVLSPNVPSVNSPTSPVKKPSYLNLACCVNGYSNLTTYDSKFRQSINKSREVSPIRPITYSVQYNRNGDNNYLSIPTAVPINDNNKHHMMDAHTILSPEKRFYSTQTQQKTIEINGSNLDCTDNVNSNGCAKFYARSMVHTTNSTINGSANTSLALVRDVNQEFDANAKCASKSFIQQRVERLYGPAAVTQGLYSPKKPKSDDNQDATTTTTTTTTTMATSRTSISSVLVEKSQNSSNTTFQSTKYVLEAQRNGHLNGMSNNRGAHDEENINLDSINDALPVLRHLRPEFRAQLPTLSPKRTIAISKLTTTALTATTPQTQAYTNGTAINGKLNISTSHLNNVSKQVTNGDVVAPQSDDLNHSSSSSSSSNSSSSSSTLDIKSAHKHQSSACNAPTNDTTKNGCLTSNKSHDIENDNRQIKIESPLNGSSPAVTHLDTRITPKILPSNDKQDINTIQMASDTSEQPKLVETTAAAINVSKTINIVEPIGDVTKITLNTTTDTLADAMDANGNHKTDQKKDALYYLNTVQAERIRLINMAIATEQQLDELLQKGDVDEEILGHLRSAAGKARLLATKKFNQFEGLCTDSINQIAREMPPPTADDLQGFWEMVYLQVENVESLFADLDKIRANGWKKLAPEKPKQPQGAKLMKRPMIATKGGAASTVQPASGTTKKSATAIAAAQKREAQRKQLAEMRRKNKLAMTTTTNAASDELIADQTPDDSSNQSNNGQNNGENETDR